MAVIKKEKQAKMGHAKKQDQHVRPPCPKCGGSRVLVHFGKLGHMVDWCNTCNAGFGQSYYAEVKS